MTIPLLDQAQLRTRGFEALVQAIGWTNAVRFVQQYESSRLNYTAERDQILPPSTAADLLRQLESIHLPSQNRH